MPASSRSKCFIGALAATILYFATALWLRTTYVHAGPPQDGAIELKRPFHPFLDSKIAYYVHAPEFEKMSDGVGANRSPFLLFENAVELGPAHSLHVDILAHGKGRFSHWSEVGFIFTSTDGTNPLTNGRTYWAVIKPLSEQPL